MKRRAKNIIVDKREITLWMGDREYEALRRALLERDTDPGTEMQKRLDDCYRELVPEQERERIADTARESSGLDVDIKPETAVFRVIENGECRCFTVADPHVDALEAASCLYRYLSGGGKNGFAAQFEPQTPITEMRYIDHVMDRLCDFEGTANVLHVDLDGGSFSTLDPENGWWSYLLQDAANSAHLIPEDGNASREKRDACFRQALDGKRIDTDDRCLRLCGDRPLRITDIEIQEYAGTEDGIVTFELELCTDMETVFGSRIAKDEDTFAVIYASYDIGEDVVRANLHIDLRREIGSEYFVYRMDAELADAVKQKMDDHCMEQDGLHLAEWAALEDKSEPWFEQDVT